MPSLDVIRTFLAGGETLEFTVSGDSMGSTLPPGSLVRVTLRAPRVGDLVLYDYGHGAAVHRAVFRRRDMIYQMGDAERAGSWLAPRQLLGTAIERRRPGSPWGRESLFTRSFQLLRSWRKLARRRWRGARPPAPPAATATEGEGLTGD
jgi:hypothetical protein